MSEGLRPHFHQYYEHKIYHERYEYKPPPPKGRNEDKVLQKNKKRFSNH